QGAAAFLQGRFVNRLLVDRPALPAAPDDALPFVGQRPHCGVMSASLLALLPIVSRRPPAVQDRFLGVLVKTLFVKLRAQVAPMHVTLAAALLGHRRDATEALEVLGLGIAFPLRSQAGQ